MPQLTASPFLCIRALPFVLTVALAALVAGCASLESSVAPGTDLSKLTSFYVLELPADERGVGKMISDCFDRRGFEAIYGTAPTAPSPVDAVVTYEDQWMWDLTVYMLSLGVQIRDPGTGLILASGQSTRASLVRRSPQEMVEEVRTPIFRGSSP